MDVVKVREEFSKRGWSLKNISDDTVKDLANNTLTGNRILLNIALQDFREEYKVMITVLDWLYKKIARLQG